MAKNAPYGSPSAMLLPKGSYTRVGVDSAQTVTIPNVSTSAAANGIILQAEGQIIRFTIDGTTPTASNGFRLLLTAPPFPLTLYPGCQIKAIGEANGGFLSYQFTVKADDA